MDYLPTYTMDFDGVGAVETRSYFEDWTVGCQAGRWEIAFRSNILNHFKVIWFTTEQLLRTNP